MKKVVVHVAEMEIYEESGMGRVAWHWKNEFEKRGYEFIHIGPTQAGSVLHKGLFPYAAYRAYKKLDKRANLFLVHEPASGPFVNSKIPTVVFSHGLERRSWQLGLQGKAGDTKKIKLRTRIFFPIWRLRQCDIGLRKAISLLLINQEDLTFAQNYYHQDISKIFVFKNGVNTSNLTGKIQPQRQITVLFLGTWLKRKGIKTLVEAAKILHKKGVKLEWLLAGTLFDRETVLNDWSDELQPFVKVIPSFQRTTEEDLLAKCNIFVLPSFFEGQPLALLQAMEAGRCCITTNCCGQRDLIHHDENGLLYEPGDYQQLAFLIEQCVNEEIRIKLGSNAKLSVKNRSWENVSAEVVDRIENVMFTTISSVNSC